MNKDLSDLVLHVDLTEGLSGCTPAELLAPDSAKPWNWSLKSILKSRDQSGVRGVSNTLSFFVPCTHIQVGQAGCGWWVQCSYRTNQLPVLLWCGPCCHWEGGEAVVAADQRHTQTLPGTHMHTDIHICIPSYFVDFWNSFWLKHCSFWNSGCCWLFYPHEFQIECLSPFCQTTVFIQEANIFISTHHFFFVVFVLAFSQILDDCFSLS